MRLTINALEQYLFCPRYFYFREIKGMRLYEQPYRTLTLTLRNKVHQLTSLFISNISQFNNQVIDSCGKLSLECAFAGRNSNFNIDFNLREKVFTFLYSILKNLGSKNGKNSTYSTNSFILNPIFYSESLSLLTDSSFIVLNGDGTNTWVLQTYSMPYELDDEYFYSKFHMLLAYSLKMLFKNIITIDYRNMCIHTKIFDEKELSLFESHVLSFLDNIETNNFDSNFHNCKYCEFNVMCSNIKE